MWILTFTFYPVVSRVITACPPPATGTLKCLFSRGGLGVICASCCRGVCLLVTAKTLNDTGSKRPGPLSLSCLALLECPVGVIGDVE